MEDAGVEADDIDLIVVGTTSPDLVFPNVGTLVQQRLGIHGCPAFSVEAACTGFIYALSTADKYIRLGDAKCALVIGAEVLSKLVDWTDRSTCVLFGDGAGAVVVKPSEEQGIISCHLGADGKYRDLLYYPVGPSKNLELAGVGDSRIIMSGNEVFKVAVKTLGAVAGEALRANGIDQSELDWLVPHQANTPHYSGDRKTTGPADGESDSNGAGSRQHLRRIGAHGPRCRYSRRSYRARPARVDGSLRGWLHLGFDLDALLSAAPAGVRATRRPLACPGRDAVSLSRSVRGYSAKFLINWARNRLS